MKYIFLLLIIACASTTQAQLTMRLKHPELPARKFGLRGAALPSQTDSIYNAVRPIINTGIEVPSMRAVAGAGISFQHLDFNFSTQRFTCIWSVSAMAWVGGNIPPATFPPPQNSDPNSFISYGIMGGVLNNNITLGLSINHKKPNLELGWTYNFNN